jgi:hypothetical protein
MLGGGQDFDKVVDLVHDWIPNEDYGHENDFQKELQNFLEEQLNEKQKDSFGLGSQQNYEVSRERGTSRADIAVNDEIGIEMKRDFSNSQEKKLKGQIEDQLDNYNFVIVCACGIKDKDGWNRLKNKYEGQQGMGMEMKQVEFIYKKKDNYGEERNQDQDSLGGGFF